MSIYRHKTTPFWRYDFVLRGQRYHGSTRTRSLTKARSCVAQLREQITSEARDSFAPAVKRGQMTLCIIRAEVTDLWYLCLSTRPHERLAEMQKCSPDRLSIFKEFRGNRAKKLQLQSMLQPAWPEAAWFTPDPSVLAKLKA